MWPNSGLLGAVTRDLWTPFGLLLIARKTEAKPQMNADKRR
jgi:hypothetical protein